MNYIIGIFNEIKRKFFRILGSQELFFFIYSPVPYFGVGEATPDKLFFGNNSVAIQVKFLNRNMIFSFCQHDVVFRVFLFLASLFYV